MITENIPQERCSFNYYDKVRDSQEMYKVDCRINGLKRPLYLFGVLNDSKCKDVTINLLNYEKWETPYKSIVLFQDQEQINRRVLAKLTDLVEKQFSSSTEDPERIKKYLKTEIS